MTTGRHLVHESLYDAYVSRARRKGHALRWAIRSTGRRAGPVIDEQQLKHIDSIVQDTVLAGAEVAAGGTHDGLFYRPTVLAGPTPAYPAWREEIFGPVAPVVASPP